MPKTIISGGSPERPIIFSDESIVRILEGRKTQTRRALRRQPRYSIRKDTNSPSGFSYTDRGDIPDTPVLKCPYGQIGDRLWVREWWTTEHRAFDGEPPEKFKAQVESQSERLYFRGDSPNAHDCRYWRNPLFMPRWASRLMVELSGIRLETLHSISCDDVLAEGCAGSDWREYARQWDRLNARRGFDWESNPWVWVLEFHKIG